MEQSLLIAVGLALAPALPQEPRRPQGVTLPENQEIATQLADADRMLADGNARGALQSLQSILAGAAAVVVRTGANDLLFAGARQLARERLTALEGESAAAWEALTGAAAAEALGAALYPPEPAALLAVARRFPATAAAAHARAAAAELLLDRGELELARALGADVPAALAAAIPSAPLISAALTPAYSSLDDPALPLLRAASLRPGWIYPFHDPPAPGGEVLNYRLAIGAGVGYLSDGRELVALDLATGAVHWRHEVPGWGRLGSREREDLEKGTDPYTLLAPVLAGDLVIAALQEPVFLGRDQEFRGIPVRRFLPARRLYACDATTGAVRWMQRVPWIGGGDPVPRDLVAAPPAVAGGRVYVPMYNAPGSIDLWLVALDLATGTELWRTFLVSAGRESTNLFGNVLQELAAAPPAADAVRVLVCSNLGAVSCVDAASGEILWTRLYERTFVQTSQSGRQHSRYLSFYNTPPAYDGRLFVCTPTDAREALAVEAASGRLVGLLDSANQVRRLVALLPEGAYFTGSTAAFRALPAYGARQSMAAAGLSGARADAWTGVLAQGEFLLATATGAVLRLDPVSWSVQGMPLEWNAPTGPGPLQAGPGMVLVLGRNGVSAFSSPDALLEYLLRNGRDPQQLATLIPYLEALDPNDAEVALRVAAGARTLAATAPTREAAERLWLVSGRAAVDAGRLDEAGTALQPLLRSNDAGRRIAAAALLVEALERRSPPQPALPAALAVLEAEGVQAVPRRSGATEPLAIVTSRARFLAAVAAGNDEQQRNSLVLLLRATDDGGVLEDGLPIQDWARRELDLLLRDPAQAAALERDAAAAFATGGSGAALLRAYAGTAAAQAWLEQQSTRIDLDRGGMVELASWLRDYGAAGAHAHVLDPKTLFASGGVPALPSTWEPRGELSLLVDGRRWLVVDRASPNAGSVRLLLRDRSEIRLLAGRPPDLAELWLRELPPHRDGRAAAGPRLWLTASGVTAVVDDRWLRWDDAGVAHELALPGALDAEARCGRMVALLCRRSEQISELQVRDLDSGALFRRAQLTRQARGLCNVLLQPEAAFALEAERREGLRFDLLRTAPAVEIAVPQGLSTDVLYGALPYADGFAALARSGERRYAMVAWKPERWFQHPLPSNSSAYPFAAPGGVGWLLETDPGPGSRGVATSMELYWLAADSDLPTRYALPSVRLYKPPELESRYSSDTPVLPMAELLYLTQGSLQETVVNCLRADAPGSPELRWTRSLEVPFSSLQRLQVPALRGAGGWVVPLYLHEGRNRSKLALYVLDDTGTVRAETMLPAPVRPELHLLEGLLQIRFDQQLLWLGTP